MELDGQVCAFADVCSACIFRFSARVRPPRPPIRRYAALSDLRHCPQTLHARINDHTIPTMLPKNKFFHLPPTSDLRPHESTAIRFVSQILTRNKFGVRLVSQPTDFRRLADPCLHPSAAPHWPIPRDAQDGEGEAHSRGVCTTEF